MATVSSNQVHSKIETSKLRRRMLTKEWKKLRLGYTLNDVQPASPEAVEYACLAFRKEGLKVF